MVLQLTAWAQQASACVSGCWTGVCRRGRAWQFQQQLLGSVALLTATFQMAACCIEPVSRRACNSSYVLWSASLSLQLLSVLVVMLPTGEDKQAIPILMMNVNNCLMPVFLSANILTGIVNMSMDTLVVPNAAARLIVLTYMAALCCTPLLLLTPTRSAYFPQRYKK